MAVNSVVTPSVAPLLLGGLRVDLPVVLAPMAGVTNAAFRQLCRSYGAGLYVSEMITARALVENNARTLQMLAPAQGEPVRSVQIYGVDPAVVGAAVRRLVDDIGVDHVDINFGCPAAKVTRKGGGAALPLHRVLFRSVVRAAVGAAGSVPVTIKMRIGLDDEHQTYLDAGRAAAGEGVAAVALHARTAYQHYAGQADWGAIAALKEAVADVPVLGNGDIWEAADARAMMEATGCDGVVIGRGCLGRPWLFADLADLFAGRAPRPHTQLGEVASVMRTHADLLAEHLGPERAVRDFRKHTGWYLTGFPVGAAVRAALSQISSLAELGALLDGLDPGLVLPDVARRMARGHTNGPRPVALPDRWLDDIDDPTPPAGADSFNSGG